MNNEPDMSCLESFILLLLSLSLIVLILFLIKNQHTKDDKDDKNIDIMVIPQSKGSPIIIPR